LVKASRAVDGTRLSISAALFANDRPSPSVGSPWGFTTSAKVLSSYATCSESKPLLGSIPTDGEGGDDEEYDEGAVEDVALDAFLKIVRPCMSLK
jgi:hypothetical protein